MIFFHHTLRRFVVIELKVGPFQESVGIILCTERNETVAKLALHRVYAPIAVSTWRSDTRAELPPVEVTDDVPEDLSELDEVRARLLDRVARRRSEIVLESLRLGKREPAGGGDVGVGFRGPVVILPRSSPAGSDDADNQDQQQPRDKNGLESALNTGLHVWGGDDHWEGGDHHDPNDGRDDEHRHHSELPIPTQESAKPFDDVVRDRRHDS